MFACFSTSVFVRGFVRVHAYLENTEVADIRQGVHSLLLYVSEGESTSRLCVFALVQCICQCVLPKAYHDNDKIADIRPDIHFVPLYLLTFQKYGEHRDCVSVCVRSAYLSVCPA